MSDHQSPVIPKRPYLLRALYQWALDSNVTPHIIVDATIDGVNVPNSSVTNGRVVLNISPSAVPDLEIANDRVTFHTRFQGTSWWIDLPISTVIAFSIRETNEGMVFPQEAFAEPTDSQPPPSTSGKGPDSKQHHLRVVK